MPNKTHIFFLSAGFGLGIAFCFIISHTKLSAPKELTNEIKKPTDEIVKVNCDKRERELGFTNCYATTLVKEYGNTIKGSFTTLNIRGNKIQEGTGSYVEIKCK